jgi:hypothetical protein
VLGPDRRQALLERPPSGSPNDVGDEEDAQSAERLSPWPISWRESARGPKYAPSIVVTVSWEQALA